ncbi:MAG: hypothetical protein ACK5RL_19845 [Acidimicrobiales bacterium]
MTTPTRHRPFAGPTTKRQPRGVRARVNVGVAVVAVLLVPGCSVPGGLLSADETTTVSPTPIETMAATTTVPVSANAMAVRSDTSARADLTPDVRSFVETATDQRLDEIGQLSCSNLSPGLDSGQFGARSVTVRDQLTPAEREQLSLGEFSQLFEVVARVYCPDLVPDDVTATTTTTTAPTTAPSTDGSMTTELAQPEDLATEMSAFRAALAALLEEGHSGVTFAEMTSDQRLFDLAADACSLTDPNDSQEALGLAVIQSYTVSLSGNERSTIDIESYAELFGAFVGWFCPQNLPPS